jgi:hypothetical protein
MKEKEMEICQIEYEHLIMGRILALAGILSKERKELLINLLTTEDGEEISQN